MIEIAPGTVVPTFGLGSFVIERKGLMEFINSETLCGTGFSMAFAKPSGGFSILKPVSEFVNNFQYLNPSENEADRKKKVI